MKRLFLDDRQSRAFFPVQCQHQELTQTKAYRTASAHSSGLKILAEVRRQIAKLSLEMVYQGTK